MTDDPASPPRRPKLPPGWRGAFLVIGALIAAVPIVGGAIFAVSPCGGDFCFNLLGWIFALGGVLLGAAVFMFATGRTAAPLYVIVAFLGGGLAIQAAVVRGQPFNLQMAALVVVGLVALVDLRSQTRSTIAAVALLVILAVTVPPSSKYPVTGGLALLVALLPLPPWAWTTWHRRRSASPPDNVDDQAAPQTTSTGSS